MTRRGPRRTEPSPVQLMVLQYMREFFAEQDQLPPVAYIARRFGWYRNGAMFHVDALVAHGLVELNACGRYRFTRQAEKGGAA